jgi:hypothetical protein
MRSFSLYRLIKGKRPSPYGFFFTLRPRAVNPQLLVFSEHWWQLSTMVLALAALLFFTPVLLQHFVPRIANVPALTVLFGAVRVLSVSLGCLATVSLLIRRDLRISPRKIEIILHLFGLRFWSTTCPRLEAKLLIFRVETSGWLTVERTAAFMAVETPNDRFSLAARPLKSELNQHARELSQLIGLPVEDRSTVVEYI